MLIEVAALGLALLAGVRPWQLGLLAVVTLAPAALIVPITYVVVKGRRSHDDRMPQFCDAVASELRSGATLRSSLMAACRLLSIDPGPSDGAVGDVAAAVARELPRLGPELLATVDAVSRSGSAASDLFDELAAHAISHNEILHEVVVASAPARATAWFFVLAPVGFLLFQGARGNIAGLLAEPTQRVTSSIGVLLFAAGLGWMVLLMRKAT